MDERASDLKYGPGSALWRYWTKGAGFAKWSGAVHKWTTLHRLLLEAGVPPRMADGLATNIIQAVMPGYMKQAHAKSGRASAVLDVSEPEAADMGDTDRATAPKPYGDVKYADPKNGKYPIDTAEHAKAAWSYISMPKNAAKYPLGGVTLAEVKARIKAACKKFGIEVSETNSAHPDGEYRTVPFGISSTRHDSDGLTFEGYAAVYGHRARITGTYEEFDEQIMPGAFRSITDGKYPKLLFEHGRHPLIGTLPIGVIRNASEDTRGLWIEGRLTDNWLIQPVRDAVADQAVDGMSIRFFVHGDDGETWEDRAGDVALRSLHALDVPELGPVVFPAYEPTTASVRSALDSLPVIGRPPAGAGAASDREGGGVRPGAGTPARSLQDRFRRDGEALALRGIKGARF